MVDLTDGERSLRICLLVSTKYRNVKDIRRTDGRTHDIKGRAYNLAGLQSQDLAAIR